MGDELQRYTSDDLNGLEYTIMVYDAEGNLLFGVSSDDVCVAPGIEFTIFKDEYPKELHGWKHLKEIELPKKEQEL